MTPKTLEQIAQEYVLDVAIDQHGYVAPFGEDVIYTSGGIEAAFLAGAKAALNLPEVLALVDAAKLGLENTSSDFCAHFGAPDCAWCRPFNEALAAFDRLKAEVGE